MTLHQSLLAAFRTPSARLYAAAALLNLHRADPAPSDAMQAVGDAFRAELRGALDTAPSIEAAAPVLGVPARTLDHWVRTWMPEYLTPRNRARLARSKSAANRNH